MPPGVRCGNVDPCDRRCRRVAHSGRVRQRLFEQPGLEHSGQFVDHPGTAAPGAETITAQLKTADGTPVANATFDWSNGYATVTVETIAGGILSPGFHGLHLHSVGRCEADSVAPSGGAPGNFNSAGGHLQVPGHAGHPASGDLTSLQVRSDGSAKLVTTTNAFTKADLSGPEGSALIIHEGADNFANIPPRYSVNGKPGPDEQTMATGDAGKQSRAR